MSPAFPRRLLAILTFVLCGLAGLGQSRAQMVGKLSGGEIDLQVFRPAVDSKGFITLNASQILAPKDFSFGLVSTWVRLPLEFEGDVAGAPSKWGINNLITSSFQGAVGIFARRQIGLELGVVVPINIMSGRADPTDVGTTDSNDDREYKFDAQGLGDIVLHP